MPSFSFQVAWIGHTLVHGGFSHWWHWTENDGIVVMLSMLQVDPSLLFQPEHQDPMDLRVAGLVVFPHAPIHAPAAPDAPGQVEAVPVQHALHGRGRLDFHRFAVGGTVFFFEPLYDIPDLGPAEFPEILLEKRFPDGGGCILPGKSQRAQPRRQSLQRFPAREPEDAIPARFPIRHGVLSSWGR